MIEAPEIICQHSAGPLAWDTGKNIIDAKTNILSMFTTIKIARCT